jgi:hypothetical protein
MLARLCDQISECEEAAALARFNATLAPTPQMRQEYRKLEQHWRQLGRTLQFATLISGYLEWTSRRLEPPPA